MHACNSISLLRLKRFGEIFSVDKFLRRVSFLMFATWYLTALHENLSSGELRFPISRQYDKISSAFSDKQTDLFDKQRLFLFLSLLEFSDALLLHSCSAVRRMSSYLLVEISNITAYWSINASLPSTLNDTTFFIPSNFHSSKDYEISFKRSPSRWLKWNL